MESVRLEELALEEWGQMMVGKIEVTGERTSKSAFEQDLRGQGGKSKKGIGTGADLDDCTRKHSVRTRKKP